MSLRGDAGWHGMTATTTSERGDRRLNLIEDGYVSPDGNEIRSMPGFKCVYDPVSGGVGEETGFQQWAMDAFRPVTTAVGTRYRQIATPGSGETQWVTQDCKHVHCAEFVRGRLLLVGEAGPRKELLYPHTDTFTVLSWTRSSTNTVLVLSQAPAHQKSDGYPYGSFGNLAPDGGSLSAGEQIIRSYVLIEGGSSEDSGWLNNRVFQVTAISGANVTITTTTSVPASGTFATPAKVYKVRPRIGVSYPATASTAPPITDYIDDPEALCLWTGLQLPNVNGNPITEMFPAHVANRIPDFGDRVGPGTVAEGRERSDHTWQSRRRKASIPYRLNPHVAKDRLILAAPGYGCVFQCPVIAAVGPDGGASGLSYHANDVFDRPRSLGVTKASMFVDTDTTTTSSLHFTGMGTATAAIGGGHDATHTHTTGLTASALVGTYMLVTSGACIGQQVLISANTTTVITHAALSGGAPGLTDGDSFELHAGQGWFGGDYQFQVAYRDDGTGEIGLPSDAVLMTVPANYHVRLIVRVPGYLMSETAATAILVYRSEVGGAEPLMLSSIASPTLSVFARVYGTGSIQYGPLPPVGTGGAGSYEDVYLSIEVPYAADTTLDADNQPPVIEQMPMGCVDAETIRGHTFFGGRLGNKGLGLEVYQSTMSMGSNTDPDFVYFRAPDTTSPIPLDGTWGCGIAAIPSAYAGQSIASLTLGPWPSFVMQLDGLTNTRGNVTGSWPGTGEFSWIAWRLATSPMVPGASWSSYGGTTQLLLPAGTYQVSEAVRPGVTPANNTGYIDSALDEDIEAIGTHNDSAVFCTKNRTYLLSWAQSPIDPSIGALPPQLSNPGHGCIATNTMVEFEGGTAWLSNTSPVAMVGGALDPTMGADVADMMTGTTPEFLRDSRGYMRHAFACHDAERGLIYFGVYTDRFSNTVSYRDVSYGWSAASDECKSRFPCDTVLVYAYGPRAWSIWRPPQAIQWMFTGPDSSGKQRVYWIGVDKRIYALDDRFGQYNRDPFRTTISVASSGTTITVVGAFNDNLTSRGTADNFIGTSVDVLILQGSGTAYRGHGKVVSYVVASKTITLDTAVTVSAGDVVLVGARHMRIRSNQINFASSVEPTTVQAVDLRYAMTSRITDASSAVEQPCYVQAIGTVGKRHGAQDVTATYVAGYFSATQDNRGNFDYMGKAEGRSTTRNIKLTRAKPSAQEHEIDVTIIGGAQVSVVDIGVEIP